MVLPLASASGPAIIGVVVVAAGLFLSWLLRAETDDDSSAVGHDSPAEAEPSAVPAAEQDAHRTMTSQPSE